MGSRDTNLTMPLIQDWSGARAVPFSIPLLTYLLSKPDI